VLICRYCFCRRSPFPHLVKSFPDKPEFQALFLDGVTFDWMIEISPFLVIIQTSLTCRGYRYDTPSFSFLSLVLFLLVSLRPNCTGLRSWNCAEILVFLCELSRPPLPPTLGLVASRRRYDATFPSAPPVCFFVSLCQSKVFPVNFGSFSDAAIISSCPPSRSSRR